MRARRLLITLVAAGLAQACAGESAAPLPAKAATLFVDCRGRPSASPTVILESGAFGSAADWDLVLDDLAKGGRACAYDRAGVGHSPPRPGGQDVTAIARELKALLDQIGEGRPVILVGHSNGALYAETFAALWPDRVAGLLYINGVTSDDLDYPDLLHDLTVERRLAYIAALGGDVGLASEVSGMLTDRGGFSGEAARRKRQDMADPAALRVARDEDRAVIPGLATARMLGGSPVGVPTAVVSGEADPDAPLSISWRAAEQAPARRAAMRLIINVPNATHTSPLARDRGYVTTAVDWLRSTTARDEP
jgi:pimeloyl-ACP methyl ester carboxylesterase